MFNKYAYRFMALVFVLAVFAVPAGCASRPEYDRVKTENVYVLMPDELLDCEKPRVLTQEELDGMKKSQNKMMQEYVVPMYLEYEMCYNNSQRAKAYNQAIKDREGQLRVTEASQ